MLTKEELVNRDLDIFQAMLDELKAYLASRDTYWVLEAKDMPKLTLGGLLMRQHRLRVMQEAIDKTRRPWFEQMDKRFDSLLQANVIQVEQRAHDELHARIGEWIKLIQRLPEYLTAGWAAYAEIADTRVVIEALLELLAQPPYQLDDDIVTEMEALDANLRQRWQTGEFVWPPPLAEAYPPEEYWWLYGQLKPLPELQAG